jgi:hypothetical protein
MAMMPRLGPCNSFDPWHGLIGMFTSHASLGASRLDETDFFRVHDLAGRRGPMTRIDEH